jgi:transposase InsO family protein
LGSDLFEIRGKKFLIVADYLTLFPEVYQMTEVTSEAVIEKLKIAFSTHGIPEKLVTDNGPQYDSEAFRKFSRQWEFEHVTSSPTYPQSNGLAEKVVGTVEGSFKNVQSMTRTSTKRSWHTKRQRIQMGPRVQQKNKETKNDNTKLSI